MLACARLCRDFTHNLLRNQHNSLVMGDQQLYKSEVWTPEQQTKELKRRMGVMAKTLDHGTKPSFKPNPDDVIVALPPKNGTTWLTHICHQIRTKGQEPDFEDQMEVVCVIEASKKLFGIEPGAHVPPAAPRVFATHLLYPLLAEGGKKIFCFRNPKDAMVSAFHFYDSVLTLKGRVSLANFAQVYIKPVEKHINDLLIWWEHRHDDDLLLLFFDDLKEDHEGCVRRIAKFIGIDCDKNEISRVVQTTTHEEMARHASKFNTRQAIVKMAEKIGEAPAPGSEIIGRVRKNGGKSGEGKRHLPLEVQQRVDQLWKEIVTAKLGFQDLNEMCEAWKKEQSSR